MNRFEEIFRRCHPEKLNPMEGEWWEVTWLNIEMEGAEHRYRPEYGYAFLMRCSTSSDRSMSGLWICYRVGDRKRTKEGKLLRRRFRYFRLSRRAPCECCRAVLGLPPMGRAIVLEEEVPSISLTRSLRLSPATPEAARQALLAL
jgi:hypothetical protein